MKVREITQQTINFISNEEGSVLHIYADIAGKKTIGVGHLLLHGEEEKFKDGITDEQCDKLLRHDLQQAASAIMRLIKVPLSDNQYTALLSFCFNLGAGNLQASTLRSKLNRGEYLGASSEFEKWCWAGGKKSKGLYNRRIRERQLFLLEDSNEEESITEQND